MLRRRRQRQSEPPQARPNGKAGAPVDATPCKMGVGNRHPPATGEHDITPTSTSVAATAPTEFDVVVVGAGFAGHWLTVAIGRSQLKSGEA